MPREKVFFAELRQQKRTEADCATLWDSGFRLVYAEIDLQPRGDPSQRTTCLWQDLDRVPDYPVLNTLMNCWMRQEGVLIHQVRVHQVDPQSAADLLERGYSLGLH